MPKEPNAEWRGPHSGWTAAGVEAVRRTLVERLSEIDNDHLLSALNHGCGPEHDPVVRAYVDFAKSQREEDEGE